MKRKLLIFIAGVAVAASPLLALAASVSTVPTTVLTGNEGTVTVNFSYGNGPTARFYLFDNTTGNNVSGNGLSATGSSINWASLGLPIGLTPDTYTLVINDNGYSTGFNDGYCGAGQTLSSCSIHDASTQITITAPAGVPKVASSDIAAVGGPILGVFVTTGEWTLENFGPPLFIFLLVLAVFFAIYHRVKVGKWL